MAQAGRNLTSHWKIVIALEARNPLPGIIVKRPAYSDRPITEFVENALQRAHLPQRIDGLGDRIRTHTCGPALRTRARQWNRIDLLCGFSRPTPRQLRNRSGRFAGEHRQWADREDRRRMSPRLQIEAVRQDRRDSGSERQRAHTVARITQHQPKNARQPHTYEGAVCSAQAIADAFQDGYFTHAFVPGTRDLPESSLQPAPPWKDRPHAPTLGNNRAVLSARHHG